MRRLSAQQLVRPKLLGARSFLARSGMASGKSGAIEASIVIVDRWKKLCIAGKVRDETSSDSAIGSACPYEKRRIGKADEECCPSQHLLQSNRLFVEDSICLILVSYNPRGNQACRKKVGLVQSSQSIPKFSNQSTNELKSLFPTYQRTCRIAYRDRIP